MTDHISKEEKQNKIEQMQNLIVLLNQASKAYYQESREIMPNHEYDRLYDMLESLEKETGVTLSNSPTMRVGYEVLSNLPKEKHPQKMLSLDKTKDAEQLKNWRPGRCHELETGRPYYSAYLRRRKPCKGSNQRKR